MEITYTNVALHLRAAAALYRFHATQAGLSAELRTVMSHQIEECEQGANAFENLANMRALISTHSTFLKIR